MFFRFLSDPAAAARGEDLLRLFLYFFFLFLFLLLFCDSQVGRVRSWVYDVALCASEALFGNRCIFLNFQKGESVSLPGGSRKCRRQGLGRRGGWSPSSGGQQSNVTVLAHRWPSFPCPHVVVAVSVCVLISSKDASHKGLGPPHDLI